MASTYGGVPQDAVITVAFSTSSWAGEVRGVRIGGQMYTKNEITAIEDAVKSYKMGATKENSDLSLTVLYDPSDAPPVGEEDTVTLTFATPSGMSSGASIAFVGGIYQTGDVEFSKDGSGAVEQEFTMFVNSQTITPASS